MVNLVIDDVGSLEVDAVDDEESVDTLAAGLCETLGPLLVTELASVEVRALRNGDSQVGLVMLSERGPAGVRFRAGSASGASAPEAVAQAILQATKADRGVLLRAAERFATAGGVLALTVIKGAKVMFASGESESTQRHDRLVASLPGAGRLATATETAEYRVLRLPDAALALTADPKAEVLDEVDHWMGLVQEHDAP